MKGSLEYRKYHRLYYKKRRQKLWDYLGGKCVVCGSTKNLHFDHINPDKKAFDIKRNLTLNATVKAELRKCQLLCDEHHIIKTISEKEPFSHGTVYGWMKKKCTCPVCVSHKKAWNDARNVKRRRIAALTGT